MTGDDDPGVVVLTPADLDEARRYVEGGPAPRREVVARILADGDRLRADVVDLTSVCARMMDDDGPRVTSGPGGGVVTFD